MTVRSKRKRELAEGMEAYLSHVRMYTHPFGGWTFLPSRLRKKAKGRAKGLASMAFELHPELREK